MVPINVSTHFIIIISYAGDIRSPDESPFPIELGLQGAAAVMSEQLMCRLMSS
jgi:hypothetical protein